jgi:hypothetical protein
MGDGIRWPSTREAIPSGQGPRSTSSASQCSANHHADTVVLERPHFELIRAALGEGWGGGPPDAPERMSIAGIRIPDSGTELAPRAHYDNAVAAFYAREGKTHFAELIEAGHGCAACHLTHGLNGVPSNKELDLVQYARVALHTKIARDTVELFSFAYAGAVGEFSRLTSGVAKIGIINATDELGPLVAQRFATKVAESPIASHAYRQLQKNGTELILDFGEPPDPFTMGHTFPYKNRVVIYMRNVVTTDEAASALVHEGQHVQRFYRGMQLGTQADELRSVSREFIFKNGRRPTGLERAQLRAKVASDYAHLPKE